MMLSGSMVAVVTPMDADGTLNYAQFAKVVEFHVASGTQALVVAGTTGESATLDHAEHIEVIEKACEFAAGRIPIVAGTGSNSTTQTLHLSRAVDRLPVVAFLVVTPYNNKPTQEGMPPFLADCRCREPAADSLQRARPHRRRLEAGHRYQVGRASEHSRDQRGHRGTESHSRAQRSLWTRVQATERR
jgi:hypothetical protein